MKKINNATKTNCENKKRKNNFDKQKINKNSKKNNNFLKFDNKDKLLAYIKVLFDIYKSLPKIISLIDRIIEKKASTLLPASSIYGDSYLETHNQINKVLDMTERKDKLLNLYIIIENMLNSLNNDDKKFAILRFIKKARVDDIAKEFNLTERSIYRKNSKVLENVYDFMIKQNWNISFLESQIGNEPWIKEMYIEKLNGN